MDPKAGKEPIITTPEQKTELTTKLGSELHDEWRAPRKLEDGSYEPRVKKTKDEDWIQKNGSEEVDIANTTFEDLPADWQAENMAAASVAMSAVIDAAEQGRELNDELVEEVSSIVHDEWLKRNGEWAEESQKLPYSELTEEEKAKDRAQVKKAIEIYNSRLSQAKLAEDLENIMEN